MPQYKTRFAKGDELGIFTAQRPSGAACKAFTSWARKVKEPGDTPVEIQVMTEGRKNYTRFMVSYETVDDPFLGILRRPVARKFDESTVEQASSQNA